MGKKDKKDDKNGNAQNGMELEERGDSKNNKEKHGKPLTYDPTFNGPIKKRSCTDVICCILFLVFVLGLAVVAFFAFAYGDPQLLLYPMDSEGNLCGRGKMIFKPNLFFFDLVECARMGPGVFVMGCPTPQVCVANCPDKNWVFALDVGNQSTQNLICKYDTSKNSDITTLVRNKDCAAYYLNSTAVINRCLPINDLANIGSQIFEVAGKAAQDAAGNNVTNSELQTAQTVFQQFLKAKEYAEKVVADLAASWYMIVAALILACLVSLLWIILMRWLAGVMIGVTLICFVGLFGAGCGVCLYFWWKIDHGELPDDTFTFYMGFTTFTLVKSKLLLGAGITAGIIFVIVVLILLFLAQRLCIAVALIKESSRAVGSMLFTLLWPIFPFVLQLGVVALWGLIAVYLASIGRDPNLSENNVTLSNGTIDYNAVRNKAQELFQSIPCDSAANDTGGSICGYLKYAQGDYSIWLQVYNLFMLFWLVNFVVALGQMTLAGAFASYYWAFEKPRDIPAFPLLGSLWRCFRYHLGTLAFGSLLIAIVQIIRVFLEYLDHKLSGSENPVAKFFLKCLKCCFWCLEKFLKFLNKNAYILCAVYGKNFCVSAKNAFMLIMRNIVRVVVIDKVTDFLMLIGKLVVVGGVGTATYFFFDGSIPYLSQYTPSLNFQVVPLIVVILGSYIIACCFFSVYSMAVDTLFLCFLEDLERHDGSAEKPYYMSKSLMKILGKKNAVETKKD